MDTSAFGWPISAPIKRVGSKLYVEARETLTVVLTVILMQNSAKKECINN